MSIRIVPLADVPHAVAVLADLFTSTWAPYYGPDGPGDAERDLRACCQRDAMPLALVALDDAGMVIGTAALKASSLPSHKHLSPWLAALLVAPEHRGRGIASALVRAIESQARRLGVAVLYSDTDAGSGLLLRLGWQPLESGIPTLRAPATLYRRALTGAETDHSDSGPC